MYPDPPLLAFWSPARPQHGLSPARSQQQGSPGEATHWHEPPPKVHSREECKEEWEVGPTEEKQHTRYAGSVRRDPKLPSRLISHTPLRGLGRVPTC